MNINAETVCFFFSILTVQKYWKFGSTMTPYIITVKVLILFNTEFGVHKKKHTDTLCMSVQHV